MHVGEGFRHRCGARGIGDLFKRQANIYRVARGWREYEAGAGGYTVWVLVCRASCDIGGVAGGGRGGVLIASQGYLDPALPK